MCEMGVGIESGEKQRLCREKMGLNGEYGFHKPIPGQVGNEANLEKMKLLPSQHRIQPPGQG